MDALVFASQYPLSIVVVGVGDGPWDLMHNFDDNLPQRTFDNFQFVEFNRVVQGIANPTHRETRFALEALMEIPEQFRAVRDLDLFHRQPTTRTSFPPPRVLPPPEPLPAFVPMFPGPTTTNYAPQYPMQYPGLPPQTSFPNQSFAPKSVPPPFQPPPPSHMAMAAPLAEVVVPCPVCTFDNPATASRCHICDAPLAAPGVNEAPARPSADQDRLVHVVREMHEAQLCPICEDQKKDVVFQCGHETCTTCGDQLSLCPICRVAITQRIRRFVS
ncbi:Aste57867_19859 [Aphanomyces stellatus]|uniref:Aste57867_19859 protein n=1 Tax=Aphanomyces stellatus TaxID=120398 RepID=A0A485LFH1_9STRA|nr:hypothetical protein As57867_019793 [Aphanomyces stellatus]VFT96557.1 Aste57867_19859 [Aphanomyces stellatus]